MLFLPFCVGFVGFSSKRTETLLETLRPPANTINIHTRKSICIKPCLRLIRAKKDQIFLVVRAAAHAFLARDEEYLHVSMVLKMLKILLKRPRHSRTKHLYHFLITSRTVP